MPIFTYSLRTPEGALTKGTLESATQAQAMQDIRKLPGTLVGITEKRAAGVSASGKPKRGPIFGGRVPLKERIIFTEQLAVMMKAGVSLTQALRGLRDEAASPALKRILTVMVTDIEGGTRFSDALGKHPRVFSTIFVQMIKSAEQSGTISEVLARLTLQQQKEYQLAGKVRGALMYPAIVSMLMVAVIILVVTFIIPKISVMFVGSGTPLPSSTLFLLAMSDFFVHDWYWAILGVVVFALTMRWAIHTKRGSMIWDGFVLRIPVLGSFLRKSHMARFCESFASLAQAGVPVLEIFKISQGIVDSPVYAQEIQSISRDVENGTRVSVAIRKSRYFPAIIGQLVSVGEQSGDLGGIFTVLGNFFEEEVDGMARNLSSLLEPVIMIVMGIVVGFILVSVLQPIYGLVNTT